MSSQLALNYYTFLLCKKKCIKFWNQLPMVYVLLSFSIIFLLSTMPKHASRIFSLQILTGLPTSPFGFENVQLFREVLNCQTWYSKDDVFPYSTKTSWDYRCLQSVSFTHEKMQVWGSGGASHSCSL